MLKPFMEKTGTTLHDLGLQTTEEANAEYRQRKERELSVGQSEQKADVADRQSPQLEYISPSKVDTPAQGRLSQAREGKTRAYSEVKRLRQAIKDEPVGGNRQGLRLEIIKAEDRHNEFQRMERESLEKIEKRANELGKTTKRTPKNESDTPKFKRAPSAEPITPDAFKKSVATLRQAFPGQTVRIHEMTHAGLARLFGLGIAKPLADIYAGNANVKAAADALAKRYGYNQRVATEEALADLGGGRVGVKGFGKLVAYVRDKLRALGLVSTWSDNDVAALVQKAREAAKSPTTVTRAGDLSRFSFAGMNAKTADKFALANALERLDAGENADTVRQDTGWFIGPDGRARYEISDRDARLKMPASGKAGDALRGTTTVGALLNHAKLFSAYPGAAGIEVSTKPGEGASFQAAHEGRPARIRIGADMPMGKVTSALMHEIQHYVQRQEGFATGSNLLAAGSREAYFNSAGEVEARNVQTRLKMTDEERKGLAPHWTTDVLDQDVIVSFNGKDMAMVPAWHGSPHDFDRFSLDKIGTGEGAQAYGHGLYFAGKREIAD